MPYSLFSQVEKEYDKLVEADILYPVIHSSWASPVVHVPKADGAIQVCGDYKALNERIDDCLMCEICLPCYLRIVLPQIPFLL